MGETEQTTRKTEDDHTGEGSSDVGPEERGRPGRPGRRQAHAARSRADARRALAARTSALSVLSARMRRVRQAREAAYARRDARVSKAVERADTELEKRVGELKEEETTIVTEALAVEGATTKEIALWLEMSSRAVNEARREQAGRAAEESGTEDDSHPSGAE